jgi:Kef-type K+ transport system membrane component KefB
MTSAEFVLLALQLGVMLVCAMLGGLLMKRLHQPAVLGEMLGGIVLGPTVFGMLSPGGYAWLFPSVGATELVRNGFIKLGMLFFLFQVGMGIDLAALRRCGRTALLIGVIGTLVPLAAGMTIVFLLPGLWNVPPGQRLAFALFLGACLANTANPVLARILYDLGLIKRELGTILLTATVVDDLVGWCLLAVVIGQMSAGEAGPAAAPALSLSVLLVLAFFAGVILLGRFVGLPLLRAARAHLPWPGGFLASVIVIVLLIAAGAEQFGMHAFVGPFLVGIALAPLATEEKSALDGINRFVLSFFVPIYFVSMGLTANFMADFQPLLALVILLTACTSKVLSAYSGARLAGLDNRTSWAVGFGMNARGAIGIILAGLGLENQVIDRATYVALVTMCLFTALLAGPMMRLFLSPASETASTAIGDAPRA